MALWKDPVKSSPSSPSEPTSITHFDVTDIDEAPPVSKSLAATVEATPRRAASDSESCIATDLVIEGKIDGSGHVRIAGRFKGDINVHGDVDIEDGAKVDGSVRAERVTIAGELVGNIENAAHVELLQTGSLSGDVKSHTFSVAKGSRMRGQVEFGWDDSQKATLGSQKATLGSQKATIGIHSGGDHSK